MKTNRLFLIFILSFIIILSPVNAAIETLPDPIKTGECVSLPQSYSNSTFQRISTIQVPNQTFVYLNVSMTSTVAGYFNCTFCDTTQNGQYIVNGIGDFDGTTLTWNYDFTVNPLGKNFTQQQALLYFTLFILSFIFFLICLGFGMYAPYSNKRDEMTGYIIAVENMKYVKMFFLAIAYLLLMLMFYFGYIICYAYLDLDFLGSLFNITFQITAWSLLFLFPILLFVLIANWVRDSKVADALTRGFKIK